MKRYAKRLITTEEKFGSLQVLVTQEVSPGSARKIDFLCDCGNITNARIVGVLSGRTKSCGKCNEVFVDKDQKFDKLIIEIPQKLFPQSSKKINFICDCGNITNAKIVHVLSGRIGSCGKCNEIFIDKNQKFVRLTIEIPMITKPGSHEKVNFICDCGNITNVMIKHVLSGNTTSCGRCGEVANNWYLKNKDVIRSLKTPINPEQIPFGLMIALEVITLAHKPFKAQCGICKNLYYPWWISIRSGKSLTCGCAQYRISRPNLEIAEFIEHLGFETEFEYPVNELAYDVYVPEHNLLIEYNGLKWHNKDGSKERDLRKLNNAIESGYEFMCILEHEWKKEKDQVKLLIKNKLNIL